MGVRKNLFLRGEAYYFEGEESLKLLERGLNERDENKNKTVKSSNGECIF